MLRTSKFRIFAGLATLLVLAVGISCTGFFQNPQLTTLTVGPPSANIQQGSNIQMSATGTYDDGSRKTLTKGVFWSTSDEGIAPVTSTGVVSGAASGTATITASSSSVTGTATINVTLSNVTGINIQPTTHTISAPGGTATYNCVATVSGSNPVDVSSVVTWSVNDTTGNITTSQGQTPMTVTTTSAAVPGTYTITATYATNTQTFTATATLILQP